MGRPQKPESRSNHYWRQDPVRHRGIRTTYRIKLKLEVLTRYSPNRLLNCSWPECSVNDIDMLCLDHIKNDGKSDRALRSGGGAGMSVYTKIRTTGFPDGFQTLC